MHRIIFPVILSLFLVTALNVLPAYCDDTEGGNDPVVQAYLDAATKAMYEDQDYDEALRLAEAALKLDPDNVQAIETSAGVYSMSGRPADASAAYMRLYALSGNEGCNWLNSASYYAVAAGEYETDLAFMEGHLAKNPEDRCALVSITSSYNAARRYEEALAVCDKLIGLDPEVPYYHTIKAEALEGLNRPDEALESYKTSSKLSGYVFSNMYIAIINLRQLGRYDEAIELLDASIREHPESSGAYDEKGKILILQGKNDEAEAVMLEGMEKAPSAGMMFSLAGLAVLRSDYDRALGYLDRDAFEGLDPDPFSGILVDLLKTALLAHTGKTNDALALLDGIEMPPEMSQEDSSLLPSVKLAGKVLIYYAGGNYMQAEILLDKLSEDETMQLEGAGGVLDFLRVYVLVGLKEYDEAMSLIKAREEDDTDMKELLPLVLIKRGGEGDADKARELLEDEIPAAIQGAPSDNVEQNELLLEEDKTMGYAMAYALLGRKEEMLGQLDGLIKQEPFIKLLILHMPEFEEYLDDPEFLEVAGK